MTELKLYLRDERLILSDFMPILENCGLRVIAVSPFDVGENGSGGAWIHVFDVQDSDGNPLDAEEGGALLAQAILAVRRGDATNDALNSLVLSAGLHWREVDVLRTFSAYAFQVGAVPSRQGLLAALCAHPAMAGLLFETFAARFNPQGPADLDDRRRVTREFRTAFLRGLGEVGALAEDRALRRLLLLIDAAMRTNYYRHGGRAPTRESGGAPYISIKFAAAGLQDFARSKLLYEVWVRSSRMEGIHLRGAAVARGGIRWSDRPDDFRIEVLGLVETQMIKNAVIVPDGSKGGFITLRSLTDPEARGEEGKEQYRTLIRGLLDLTDNLDAESRVVPPEGVVCHDDPDPYLVVAADKGTASFSDVANAVAAEYDFWLGDAFASGGSHGYDHKAVGITARGAWECVRRHFNEMGKDIQSEPFAVVGVGDMSGDVFGNGMLLSRQIRLVAAFDHRHIFIDPDPDPETSFSERERLFRLGRSSWEDYDPGLLSDGGMIITRQSKEVTLTEEARGALGLPDDTGELDGESLVRAVLRAPCELLWNGGIGTYVKASHETDADAGDPANDAVRVDATELRCQVVGEGGNLGLTQLARIEYSLAGGRLNTDALDNSGGVDLSDREVNLKILLNPVVSAGQMSAAERNELLEQLTDSVADLVLEDNRSQGLAISLDEVRAAEGADDFKDLMTSLEREGSLDRTAQRLPTMEQLVDRRADTGLSLCRPELCVLLAHAKLHVMKHLLAGGLPDDPANEVCLAEYFPRRAIKAAGPQLATHRLRREIIASQITNDVVDLMGAAFVHRLTRDTGHQPDEVVRAWLVAARLAGYGPLISSMHGQESLRADIAYRWLLGLTRVLDRTTRWVLTNTDRDAPMDSVIQDNIRELAALRQSFAEIVAGDDRRIFQSRVREIQELGADPELAGRLITLRFMDQLLEVIGIARETGSDPIQSGRAFFRVSEVLEVHWLRQAIFETAGDDRWQQRAAQALAVDLAQAHHRLVVEVLAGSRAGESVDEAIGRLMDATRRETGRYQTLIEEIRAEGGLGMPALSVAVREIASLGRWWGKPAR